MLKMYSFGKSRMKWIRTRRLSFTVLLTTFTKQEEVLYVLKDHDKYK